MSFAFEFVGARHDKGGTSLCPDPILLLFGRLLEGSIHLNERIVIMTASGEVTGQVGHFWDSFYDWLALPFYHEIAAETMPEPFCVTIHGIPADVLPICPGIARSLPANLGKTGENGS